LYNYITFLSFINDAESKVELRWLAGYLKWLADERKREPMEMHHEKELREAIEGAAEAAQFQLEMVMSESSVTQRMGHSISMTIEACHNFLDNVGREVPKLFRGEKPEISFRPHYY
jgi:hypothetical protein